jgi:Leucine-rich repeat (LRR) protein
MLQLLVPIGLLLSFADFIGAGVYVTPRAEMTISFDNERTAATLAGELDKIERSRVSDIKSLELTGPSLKIEHFALLKRFAWVTELKIYSGSMTDEMVTAIPALPLKSLTIRSPNVTGATFERLSSFRLETLDLSNCKLSHQACRAIGKDIHLRRLILRESGVTDEDIAALQRMVLLEELDIFGNEKLTTVGLANLKTLVQLKELHLPGQLWDGRAIEQLPPLPRLKQLLLENITEEALVHLKGFRSLRVLGIGESTLSEKSARLIAELPGLQTLNLSEVKVSPEAALALCECRSLQSFSWCPDSPLSPEFMRALARLPLVKLSLWGNNITDAEVDCLAKHPTLKIVSIPEAKISDRSLATLASLPCLQFLDILRCERLSPQGLLALKQAETLEFLWMDLEGSDAEMEEIGKELRKALPRLEVTSGFML